MRPKKTTYRDILGGMSRMQNGGVPNGPEAKADIRKNPMLRSAYEALLKDAESGLSPMPSLYTDKYPDGGGYVYRGGDGERKYQFDMEEANRVRDEKSPMLRYDNDPRSYQFEDGYVQFEDIAKQAKAGNIDAIEALFALEDKYKEMNPGPERNPIMRMFGIDPNFIRDNYDVGVNPRTGKRSANFEPSAYDKGDKRFDEDRFKRFVADRKEPAFNKTFTPRR